MVIQGQLPISGSFAKSHLQSLLLHQVPYPQVSGIRADTFGGRQYSACLHDHLAGQVEAIQEGQERNPKAGDPGEPPHPKRKEWANCKLATKGEGARTRDGLGCGGRARG